MRASYANVMATFAVVLALAAGGGQTLADAASSAATGVKRALKIGKQAKKSAKKANTKATAAGMAAAAADAKAQQALTKSNDADRLDGLDSADFLRSSEAVTLQRTLGDTWALPTGSDEELSIPGVGTLYVDCMDAGYESEIRLTNLSGEEQRTVETWIRPGDALPRTYGRTLAAGSAMNVLFLSGSPDGPHAGHRLLLAVMPADGTGPAARIDVAGTLRSPDAACVLDARVLYGP